MIGKEARDFVLRHCPYKHGKLRMHLCPKCQAMLKDVSRFLKSTEMELANAVMKWWHEMTDQPIETPDFIGVADSLTTYPGNYVHVTLVPGFVVRAIYNIVFWGSLVLFGYLLFAT